jgi:hypothetical protein
MRFLQLLIVFFAPIILLAQNAFIKEYGRTDFGNYTSANIYNIIELDSKFHVFGGASYLTPSFDAQPFSLLHSIIDDNGTILTTQIDSTSFENAYYLSSIFLNNSLYCVGKKWNDDIFNPDQRKFIQKLNKDGVVQWTKTFGDSSWSFWDNYTHQIYSHENNLIVLSTGNDGLSQTVDFTLLNENGELLSLKQNKTSQVYSYLDRPVASAQPNDGFLVIIEGSGGPPQVKNVHTLIKLDNQGNELWRKTLNNFPLPERENIDSIQQAYAVFNMENNHFGIVFQLYKMDSLNQYLTFSKMVVAEFSQVGDFIQSKKLPLSKDIDIRRSQVNNDGEIFLFGTYNDDANLFDVCGLKLDKNLNFLWQKNYGSNQSEIFMDGTTTSDGGIILTGTRFRYSPEPKGYNYYIVKTDCNGNVEWDSEPCVIRNEEEISVFGNPLKDRVLIQFPQMKDDVNLQFRLYNSIGQLVLNRQITGPIINEQVTQLSAGIYLYTVKANNGSFFSGKLMKE